MTTLRWNDATSRDTLGAMALHTVISAFTYIVAKGTLPALGPVHVAFFRFILATSLMVLLARRNPSFAGLARRPVFIVLGLLVIPLNQFPFLVGIGLSTPTHASLLYCLTPVVVSLISLLLGREQMTPLRGFGLATALAGAVWVLAEKGLDLSQGTLRGDLLIFVGVLGWSVYSVLAKPLSTRYGALPVTTWSFIWGTIAFSPVGIIFLRDFDPGAVPLGAWAGVAYLAVATSIVAYLLWVSALKRMDATQVAVFTNLQPPLTAVFSALIFGEEMTTGLILGGILTLAGVTVTNLSRR